MSAGGLEGMEGRRKDDSRRNFVFSRTANGVEAADGDHRWAGRPAHSGEDGT